MGGKAISLKHIIIVRKREKPVKINVFLDFLVLQKYGKLMKSQ